MSVKRRNYATGVEFLCSIVNKSDFKGQNFIMVKSVNITKIKRDSANCTNEM